MIEIDFDKPCTLSSLAFATMGMKIDAMHLVVQKGLKKYDKYTILEFIDQLIEEAKTIPSYGRIETYTNPEITGEEAEMKLEAMWNRKNMRNDYNTALGQQQYDEWQKRFERIIC